MTDDSTVRRNIKVWMRDVMTAKGWTASAWARKAGTSPTNITRFLQPTATVLPSSDTLSKLARAAGSQPKLGNAIDVIATRGWQLPYVPVTVVSAYAPMQLWEIVMDGRSAFEMLMVDAPLDGPAVVTDVFGMGMAARGIMPGDRIIVERIQKKDVEAGQIIMFTHEGKVKVAEWQSPLLIFHPLGVGLSDWAPIRTSEVEVYGRVRRVVREL